MRVQGRPEAGVEEDEVSNELWRRIQLAQVRAAEDVIVDGLRDKGLLPPEPTKTGIVINLTHLSDLMRQYVTECVPNVNDRLAMQLRLSAFLAWLKRKQEREETK